jgi:hypothetical protein
LHGASNSFCFSRTLLGTNVGLRHDVPSSSAKFVVRSPERGSVRPMVRDDMTDMVPSFIKGFSGAYVRSNWMPYTDAPNVTANLLDDSVVDTLALVGAIAAFTLPFPSAPRKARIPWRRTSAINRCSRFHARIYADRIWAGGIKYRRPGLHPEKPAGRERGFATKRSARDRTRLRGSDVDD